MHRNDNTDDKTYVKDSLDISDRYRKVLSVNWNTAAGKFLFESSDIINIVSNFLPGKVHWKKCWEKINIDTIN